MAGGPESFADLGSGNDKLYGGPGKDRLSGGTGRDDGSHRPGNRPVTRSVSWARTELM
ncbi:hypothetical protein [Planotetraspora phitsanulokensis]|uniref:Hemolysin-type calcium-binding repeat-containing protein n=1 Tax=Planotetraspora phitsanulokensis TaxID=575192 RepID=A0A8J3XGS2_9ACTN|nr:hypothetical protein Pph01_54330 [Planotetraspora phitsanulokensis]